MISAVTRNESSKMVAQLNGLLVEERAANDSNRRIIEGLRREVEETKALLHQKQIEVNGLCRVLEVRQFSLYIHRLCTLQDKNSVIYALNEEMKASLISKEINHVLAEKTLSLSRRLHDQRMALEDANQIAESLRKEHLAVQTIQVAEISDYARENAAQRLELVKLRASSNKRSK
jgi:hypothetical protein